MRKYDQDRSNELSLMRSRNEHLEKGHYDDFADYANCVTQSLAGSSEEILEECVSLIPTKFLPKYLAYLKNLLEPIDFMPDPGAFMVRPYSNEEVEQKKRDLRPKYVHLLELVVQLAGKDM